MKRSLYPVIKHGARFVIITAALVPALAFVLSVAIRKGDVVAAQSLAIHAWWPLTQKNKVALTIYLADSMLLTCLIGRYQHVRRRRILAVSPAGPKPQVNISRPQLTAGSQGDAIEAG